MGRVCRRPRSTRRPSTACRTRLGKAGFRRRLGDYAGCARRFGQPIEGLRPLMVVHVEDDDDLVWDAVQNTPADFPRDPADRIIGATALVEGLTLITADRDILASKAVPSVW